jgi:HSP20 family protein
MPDQPFMSVARQMNKLMDQLQKNYYNFCPSETWTPNINLYETDDFYLLCVDLSGVDKEKIDVEVHDQRLTLRGTRPVPTRPEYSPEAPVPKLRVHVMEIDHGAFCRMVDLPHDVEQQRIAAQYENGMLWIELPKKT